MGVLICIFWSAAFLILGLGLIDEREKERERETDTQRYKEGGNFMVMLFFSNML